MKLKLLLILFIININLYGKELDKISLQLQWKHQFQFAGFYIAKEKGFYKEVGLDVDLKEFKFGTDTISYVCNGKTTFATSYPSIILEKFNGKKIVLLSAILQLSPHVLVSLKSSGIKSIKDFKNKKIMIENEATLTATIKSMIESHHILFDNMIKLSQTFNIDDLLNGKTDIMTAFSSNELYELDKRDIKYDIWDPKDYGFDFYDLILFTSKNEQKNNPKRVENFRKASLKGWEYAFANIDETVDFILEKYNTQNRTKEALLYEAKVLKNLAYSNTKKLGNIDKDKIQRIYDMYNLMGLVKNKIEFDNFIYKPNAVMLSNSELTIKEKIYLKKKKHITMCIDPDWMPYEKFDKDGNHIGLSRDYFNIFQKQISIPIEVIKTKSWSQTLEFAKSRKCDILSLAMETPMRKQYMNFTIPYLSIPSVLATKNNISFINDFHQLSNKKIGIVEGYSYIEILRAKYPNLNIIEVKNVKEGLQKVSKDKLFGFVGSLADIGYSFQNDFIGELKIAGKFDEKIELGVAVRNDDLVLLNIFQKVVNSISNDDKQRIFNKYIAIKYEKGIDYTLLWRTSIGFILALGIVIFFLIRQHRLKKEIGDLNTNLELKIQEEVEKNREKDKTIFRQSKLASMGEMMNNIAHQWRQPLNRINLSLSVILDITNEDTVDKEIIKKKILVSQKNLQYMSHTIEDFSNFFRPDKKVILFDLCDVLNNAIKLISTRTQDININLPQINELMIQSHKNELLQVLLIILNNALDNFETTDIKNKKVEISVENCDDKITTIIKDNGGGIDDDIIDNIFEPYFTTKFKDEGAGLGLYMAKMLIEDSMGGDLHVVSNKNDTSFIIELKHLNNMDK